MKTIAITVDLVTLELLDEVAAAMPGHPSRSALARVALREFVERERRRLAEERERAVLKKHRRRIARDAKALIARTPAVRGDFLTLMSEVQRAR